jgi:hypothetical protein
MTPSIKTKQDLVRALNGRDVRLTAEIEVVNDNGVKTASEKMRAFLRQQKKLHVVLLERN